jgi:hypothetical protein
MVAHVAWEVTRGEEVPLRLVRRPGGAAPTGEAACMFPLTTRSPSLIRTGSTTAGNALASDRFLVGRSSGLPDRRHSARRWAGAAPRLMSSLLSSRTQAVTPRRFFCSPFSKTNRAVAASFTMSGRADTATRAKMRAQSESDPS